MPLGSDDRAVAVQVGAIVLFAFVIIAITAYQASVVPNQNKAIEFDHNQQVQRQLQDLQAAIGSAPTAGGSRTVVVESSTGYPARTIFVNPPRATGRLRTVGTGDPAVAIEVRNATATGETSDFWDGTPRNYSTGRFAFDPNYNVYTNAPRTFVENSLVYNEFTGEDVIVNAQSIFDGRRISLVALNGSYDEQSGAASVTVRPVSASSNRVSVETESSSEPLSVVITTRLSETKWETVLTEAGEYDEDNDTANAYVTDVRKKGEVTLPGGQTLNRIEFELEGGTTYSLSLAKAGVGTNVNATPTKRYVTTVSPKNVSTTAGARETLTVEVRDEFNNPLSGVPMNVKVEKGQGNITEPDGTETGNDGRVGFTYEAPDAKTDARVNVSIADADGKMSSVTFNVSVSKASGGGGGGGNGAYNVTLKEVSGTNPTPSDAVECPNWPGNRTCLVDGSELSTVTVTMGTDPTAVGASVSWAVNDNTVAAVNAANGETDSNGENSTDVTLKGNGDVIVFASSGAGGKRTTLRVTNLNAFGPVSVAFVDVNDDSVIRLVDPDGKFQTLGDNVNNSVKYVGPKRNLDADSDLEVPYVSGGEDLYLMQADGTKSLLASGVATGASLGVDASSNRVYYIKNGDVWRTVVGGGNSTLTYTTGNNGNGNTRTASGIAVAGVADVNGDGDDDPIYFTDSSTVAYIDDTDQETTSLSSGSVEQGDGYSVGPPTDFGSGVRVPIVNGNQEIVLVNPDTGDTNVVYAGTTPKSAKAPLGVVDWDGDSEEEILFVTSAGEIAVYDVADGTVSVITGAGEGKTGAGAG
ncbi:hypothetical protein [Halorubellus sp. PRR65]|uniref:hypothetical protein n=1 Tax=Halorubellus sp. PRR65 TaxID=3098148 RepID=UPI002B257810|nr:hypothetical protein [Halorubellus sp. PRR65]